MGELQRLDNHGISLAQCIEMMLEVEVKIAEAMNTLHRLNFVMPIENATNWSLATLAISEELKAKIDAARATQDTLPEGFI